MLSSGCEYCVIWFMQRNMSLHTGCGHANVHRYTKAAHLVVRGIAVGEPQVIVLDLEVQIGQDQLALDVIPDDTCHLIAIQVHHRVLHLDLARGNSGSRDCAQQT